jgi:hypothetical protein
MPRNDRLPRPGSSHYSSCAASSIPLSVADQSGLNDAHRQKTYSSPVVVLSIASAGL